MSGAQTAGAAEAVTIEGGSLLDQVVGATKQTAPDQAQDLVKNLVEQALSGTVTFDRNLTRTFDRAIAEIDRKLSNQLNAIIHSEKFLKLEGSWRGLNYLVMNSETGTQLKIRMFNASKRELNRDLTKAVEFDQSQLFKKIYENEFGTPGGEPYGTLIGDYEWTNHPDDIESLRLISNVAAAGFSPFISAAGAGMFGFDDWTELSKPRDLAKIFETAEYQKWRSFRDSEDSRFVNLVMPRVVARLPYGSATKPIDEFNYEEAPFDATGAAKEQEHKEYCWMNAAYVMGARMTDAFAQHGFCVAIRGAEGGGKVENLPSHVFKSDDGDSDTKCPTEIGITDRREFELSNLGFLPLCHYKNTA
jgi:type VI secretion system protein ImpC